MAQVLTVSEWNDDTQFARMKFSHNRRFHDFIRLGVKPLSYRQWDKDRNCWWVHADKLPMLVAAARRFFVHVDYRVLPDWVQLRIAARNGSSTSDSVRGFIGPLEQDAHTVLHLQPTAPWSVVKAAYKTLCLEHHPDRGGSVETLQKINAAYAQLQKRYSKQN